MATKTAKRPSARERLLAAADELFYRDGVHSTGIDAVIEKADVAKGSLYYIFGGKDELVAAYLRGRHEAFRQRVEDARLRVWCYRPGWSAPDSNRQAPIRGGFDPKSTSHPGKSGQTGVAS